MRPSILDPGHSGEDFLLLRQAIVQLADRCRLDLHDRTAVRGLLDGGLADFPAPAARDRLELSAMLTLLFRLEASSSEDLGHTGLRRLWSQHRQVMGRLRRREPMASGLPGE